LEDEVLADAHPRHVAEAQGVQGVLHRLALGVEQRGARHHPDLDPVRAHLWPPWGATPRADLGGGGPYASSTRSPLLITIGPAISASSSSPASKKKPSIVARSTPEAMYATPSGRNTASCPRPGTATR